ncbi:Thioredoxin-interacting protein [Dissostichus eleginoides]|uniref:Thioredoxin-interacting protein n=1 Tax=Dissostichus eleginoides TaxID=100907 RepID=A0AAD9FBR3_DISEL|nr:Thioredoxin-interacting protein [Dissostichus eleginoides]
MWRSSYPQITHKDLNVPTSCGGAATPQITHKDLNVPTSCGGAATPQITHKDLNVPTSCGGAATPQITHKDLNDPTSCERSYPQITHKDLNDPTSCGGAATPQITHKDLSDPTSCDNTALRYSLLVSSYKGKFGSVRYCVRAELDRPSQNALRCEREFEVEEPLDVNEPDLMAPATGSAHKRVTCLFIPDGQVSISARIQRKGFCEGEDISINAQFENTTSRMVVPKAAIIAKHTYSAEGRSKESREKLCCVRGNHIISGMCDTWQGKTLRVPKLRPSLLGCDIITVDYSLVIYLHIPGSEKLTLNLPLVIGTLSGVGSRTSSVSSWASLPLPPPPSWASLPQAPPSSWASLPHPPPSYSNISRDLDGPRTPLLQDYDGEEDEGGLVMRAPEVCPPTLHLCLPPPPAYSQTSVTSLDPEVSFRPQSLLWIQRSPSDLSHFFGALRGLLQTSVTSLESSEVSFRPQSLLWSAPRSPSDLSHFSGA